MGKRCLFSFAALGGTSFPAGFSLRSKGVRRGLRAERVRPRRVCRVSCGGGPSRYALRANPPHPRSTEYPMRACILSAKRTRQRTESPAGSRPAGCFAARYFSLRRVPAG
jgi:hypothetical protein